MVLRDAEHGHALRDITFEPLAEAWRGFGVALHEEAEFLIGGVLVLGVPYGAQFYPDDAADGMRRSVVDGVLREMELASLPDHASKDGPSGGPEPGMVIGGDEADATQAAPEQAVEKGAPMDLCFREGDRDPQQTTMA